jgi:acetolactate synthase-1/2/3 large subunit
MKLKGAQIMLKALKEEGVDTIFGYPGGVVIDIYDELAKSDIRHVLVRYMLPTVTPGPATEWVSAW